MTLNTNPLFWFLLLMSLVCCGFSFRSRTPVPFLIGSAFLAGAVYVGVTG